MRVKAKGGSKQLIEGEWYRVVDSRETKDQFGQTHIHYRLVNHTNVVWKYLWYLSSLFYTLEELREEKLN